MIAVPEAGVQQQSTVPARPGVGADRVTAAAAQPGDRIEVRGTPDGDPRRGEILAVLGFEPHVHFRVRWDDEHESLFYPAAHTFVVHRRQTEKRRNQNARLLEEVRRLQRRATSIRMGRAVRSR
jgi:hypothetical protein